MMQRVVPSRIEEAREARALSMADLAKSIGVTRQAISKYERGLNSPQPAILKAISLCLDFPIEFFYKPEEASFSSNSALFFRSNSTTPKKVKEACKYQIKWADEIKTQISQYVDFLPCNIPTIDENYEDLTLEDVENLALDIRHNWGLGDEPITDLIGVLENQGIIVAQFSVSDSCDYKGVDAFSAWKNGTPYMLYHSVEKSAVRTRFGLLHELGHLVMHSSIASDEATKKTVVDFADDQANRFAAAFLLPRTTFPAEIHGSSLTALQYLKEKWGVAMSTIIRRCEDLKLLSENQLNYLRRQMTAKGYWRREPLDDVLTVQGPEILRDSIMMLVENRIISKESFIHKASLSVNDLKSICQLPDSFFADTVSRQKPVLRILPQIQ